MCPYFVVACAANHRIIQTLARRRIEFDDPLRAEIIGDGIEHGEDKGVFGRQAEHGAMFRVQLLAENLAEVLRVLGHDRYSLSSAIFQARNATTRSSMMTVFGRTVGTLTLFIEGRTPCGIRSSSPTTSNRSRLRFLTPKGSRRCKSSMPIPPSAPVSSASSWSLAM
jgi:hypothetical protein